MILVPCTQGTREWFEARIGVATASRFADACARKGKHDDEIAQACLDYAADVALERVSGERVDNPFETPEMRRGRELEPEARYFYMERFNVPVEETGVILTDDRRFGYSTDGLVGDDGLIEIKCPSSALKMQRIWEFGDTAEYWHQVQGGLWITGRAWCDLCVYDPRLRLVNRRMWRRRIQRDNDWIETVLEPRLMEFQQLVDHAEAVFRGTLKKPANDPAAQEAS